MATAEAHPHKGGAKAHAPKEKAQASTEYLVVAAVVLVIALVAIALLAYYPQIGGAAKETESEVYWKSARPISITNVAQRNTTPCTGYSGGSYTMELKNTGAEGIELTDVKLGGSTAVFCPPSGTVSAVQLEPGEPQVVNVVMVTNVSCTPGQHISSSVAFTYVTKNNLEIDQPGAKDITVACNEPMGGGGGGSPGGGPPGCAHEAESCATLVCCNGFSCQAGVCVLGCAEQGTPCTGDGDCCQIDGAPLQPSVICYMNECVLR